MSFNDELLKDGRGRAIRIDVSTDKFATIAYRWGDVAGLLDGTNQYSSRVLSLGPVRRALGQNRIAGGSTCELVLANADGALDALAGRTNISTQAKLRLRIYLCLYTPGVSPLTFTSKLLGEFSLSEWVRQNNEQLTLPLGDDVLGAVAQQATLPTLQDWHAVGGSAAVNPLFDGFGLPSALSEYTPVQLAFGEDWVLALPHILPIGTIDAAYQKKVIVPICCTRDTGAASQGEITELRVSWFDAKTKATQLIDLPRTVFDDVNHVTKTNWLVERSPTITKDGKTFKIIYLVVRDDLGALNRDSNFITGNHEVVTPELANSYGSTDYGNEFLGGYAGTGIYQRRSEHGNNAQEPQYGCFAANVIGWYVKGVPLSAMTQPTLAVQHAVDVLTDLVSYYSNNTSITVDTVMAARVKRATAQAACTGVLQPWTSGPKRGDSGFQQAPSLRQVLTAICQSSDIDVFINWSSQFSFSADLWDFRVASSGSASWSPDGGVVTSGDGMSTSFIPTVIPETWLAPGLERWLPADGERWAIFNRLWFTGGKASPGDGVDAPPYQGPWDFNTAQPGAVAVADRLIEATLDQGWRPFRQQGTAPWFWRQVNVVARDMVRFRTHIGGMQLELGSYFALSWTRGPTLASPYLGAIFQCEAITFSAGDDAVEVTGVWRDDIQNEQQYILDDETLLLRSGITITNTASPGGGSTVNFGATVNLTGVLAGDLLVLRDTTQAADIFTRNGVWRITAVTLTAGANTATITANGEGNFPAAGTVASGQWSIIKGATTYPTVGSDPTNYPLGGDQYGKVTNTSGQYSNATTGNRLISG